MSGIAKPSRRQLVAGSTLGAAAALALALLVIVNYFGWKYYARFDWTAEKIYTLSERSLSVVENLDRDIQVVILMSPADELFDNVRELLRRYEAASPRITVTELDAAKNPIKAQALQSQYEVAEGDVVVFDRGDDRRVVERVDLAEFDYSGLQFGQQPQMIGFKGEQLFTGAILELAEDRKTRILFTTGHGERQIDDLSPGGMQQAQTLFSSENFDLESWASLGQAAVPEGADLLVIAGPKTGFLPPEVAVIEAYLEGGGRLLALIDPVFSDGGGFESTGLSEMLARYGVDLGEDIVVDPANPLPFYGAETIYVGDYGEHPITRSLRPAEVPVILPLARSVTRADGADDLEIDVLLRTSAEGWGEVDLTALDRVEKQENDLPGPVSLGLAVRPGANAAGGSDLEAGGGDGSEDGGDEHGSDEPKADRWRLAVFGDCDFATNSQLASVGNAELLASTVNWLVDREALVGVEARKPEQVRLNLSQAQLRNLTLLVFVLLPGLAIVAGVLVFFRRRR